MTLTETPVADALVTTPGTVAVHQVQNLFHPHLREDFTEELPPEGATVREVAVRYLDSRWGHDPDVALILNGKKLRTDEEADRPMRAGDDLVVVPDVAGLDAIALFVVKALVYAAISYGINYLLAKPKPPSPRGDSESAFHTWDGIQTNWAAGWRVPIAYGIIRVGGQVIATDVYEEENGQQGQEILALHLVLCEGPIAAIGGIDLTQQTDINGLGRLRRQTGRLDVPEGMRLNATTPNQNDYWCHLRAGTIYQAAVPGRGRGSTAHVIGKDLRQFQTQDFDTAPYVVSVTLRVRFDACYYLDQSGNGPQPHTVRFYAEAGGFSNTFTVTRNTRQPFHVSFTLPVRGGEPSPDPSRVLIYRMTPDDSDATISTCTWSEMVERVRNTDLAFPTSAQLAIEIRAGEQMSSGQPNLTVPIWGLLVRWKHGGVWQLPAFHHPVHQLWPGRNPAWIVYDFLTNTRYGLGKWISAEMIDEATLEQWAIYCDQMVDDGDGGQHPRHHYDDVIDRGESAWDVVLNICRAGRCMPWMFGNRITFKFEHPDQPLIGLPRPMVMVFAESNVEELTVTYYDRRSRPNIYDAQIVDETLNWDRGVVSQEDPAAFGLNEPWKLGAEQIRREMFQLTGITRPAHARREILWMHATNRLCYSQVTFVCGIDAFACELGDIIGVQHDVPRFFDTATGGYRTTRAGAAATSIYLDHDVELESGHSYEVCVVRSDTTPQIVAITAVAGSYPADTAITIATAQTFNKGAVAVFGEATKSVRKYQITNLEMAEELKFRVTATLYDDTAFDLEGAAGVQTAEGGAGAVGIDGTTLDSLASSALLNAQTTVPMVLEAPRAQVAVGGASGASGGPTVSWTYPPRHAGPARVYLRERSVAVAALAPTDDPTFGPVDQPTWRMVYEGPGTEFGHAGLLTPGIEYEVAVVLRGAAGVWGSPMSATPATITIEEFPAIPPPNIRRGRATIRGTGIELSWEPVNSDSIQGYEVRRGTEHWSGAQRIGTTLESTMLVEDAPTGGHAYLVRARHLNGLYSPVPLVITVDQYLPFAFPHLISQLSDGDLLWHGTHAGTEVDLTDHSLVLQAGELEGTYETLPLEIEQLADVYYWGITWQKWEFESLTLEEATFAVGSGEAHWRTLDGRESTWHQPGADFDETLAASPARIGDENHRLSGRDGAFGAHSRVKVEMAPWNPDTEAWSAWVPARSGVLPRTSRLKVRFTLSRWSERYQPHVAAGVLIEAFGAASSAVPAGTIMMWHGPLDAVPPGWALCDGTNGTPDMRDRFILGTGPVHPVGATGGTL